LSDDERDRLFSGGLAGIVWALPLAGSAGRRIAPSAPVLDWANVQREAMEQEFGKEAESQTGKLMLVPVDVSK